MKYFKACGLFGACRPGGILYHSEVLQGLWLVGHVALLGSLILVKYFKACGLFGAGHPIGIFDPDEVLQGLWPITLVHVALVRFLILLHALLSCNNRISATEILNFDKYLFLFHMSLGYKLGASLKPSR